ncbi:hypothetical protein LZ30DRAFT_604441 [Colletotrichum cereale]|nr:hypothetical protein LZ30DRAFT_604441 [Colletotrichum cereale]
MGTDETNESPGIESDLPLWGCVNSGNEPIAVVGMACRFSQVDSPSELWDLVSSSRSGHSIVPERSWNANAWYHPSRQRGGEICASSGHFLENVSAFDAPFFSLSASEAAAMDPMQRLGLEIAYEAFENAGIPMQKLAASRTAVYSGVMTNDYQMLAESDPYQLGTNSAAGTGKSMLSNRISWFFNLQGPSLTLDTACSSSLYALHLACQSLRTGESSQALVTGHNLILHPTFFSQLSSMHMVSPDGISHSFDASANGYGRGEGIAGIVVKRLSAALADGDVIRAIVRATGVNSDGKTPGITVPSEEAQVALIRRVYDDAGLDMAQTAYFEAHGTGTPKGDPIEVRAISRTIAAAREDRGMEKLFLGSVKPNVGHTEGCSGLAGLIKTVLCLEAGIIPPVTGIREINPELRIEDSHLIIPICNTVWPEGLRRASINSFGFGGANAHVVLDDAFHYLKVNRNRGRHHTKTFTDALLSVRELSRNASSTIPQPALSNGQHVYKEGGDECPLVFVTSAFDRSGINRVAQSLGSFLQKTTLARLEPLAHVLAKRRTVHSFRSFVVAKSQKELVSTLLGNTDHLAVLPRHRSSQKRRVVFLFTGQGAQRPGMATELLSRCLVFKDSIALSQAYLQQLGCQWDLTDLLRHADAASLSDAKHSQPACTAVQIALVDLLRHWGVMPSAVLGHSSGEIVAAYAAGIVSHQDAIRVAYYRGLFSNQICQRVGRQGAMLAVGLSETEARIFLMENGMSDSITVACINSPKSVTLSGHAVTIAQAEEAFSKAGHFARLLRTGGVAYHSPDMEVVGDDFLHAMGALAPRRRSCGAPMYSSVTEGLVTDTSTLTAEYWHLNMTSPVRFAGALHNLLRDLGVADIQHTTVLEIGPSRTLAGPVSQIMSGLLPSKLSGDIPYISMLGAEEDSHISALQAAGTLWAAGVDVDLTNVNALHSSLMTHRMPLRELPILPPYPWNHTRIHWHEPPASVALRNRRTPSADILGVPVLPHNPFEPAWHNVLRKSNLPWLADHAVEGTVLFPAAGYLSMAIEAVQSLSREKNQPLSGTEFSDVHFESGLAIAEDSHGMHLKLQPHQDEPWTFQFVVYATSTDPDGWRRLARGTVSGILAKAAEGAVDTHFEHAARHSEWENEKRPLIERVKAGKSTSVDVVQFYKHLATIGLQYGPTFRGLRAVRHRARTGVTASGIGEAFGELTVPDTRSVMPEKCESEYLIHPTTLDGLFQLVFAALQARSPSAMDQPAVPVFLRRAFIANQIPRHVGAKLVGMAAAERSFGKATALLPSYHITGNLTFADENLGNLAVIVEDILLRDLPRNTLTGSSSNFQSQQNAELRQLTNLRRTAELVWKEDINQSFSLWKDEINAEPNIKERCAWLVDRICYKRAQPNALFLGAVEIRDHLLQKLGDTPRLGLSDVLENTRHIDATFPGGMHELVEALRDTCSTNAWLLFVGTKSVDLDVLGSLADALASLPDITMVHDSGSKLDVILTNRDRPSRARVEDDYKELQEDVVIVGCRDVGTPASPKLATLDSVRELLVSRLKALGCKAQHATLEKVAENPTQLRGKTVVSLVELETPFVQTLSERGLSDFRSLLRSTEKMLWVTKGGFLEPASETSLHFAPTIGLLRTVRAEYPDLSLPHLDLSPRTCSDGPEKAVEMVVETLRLTSSRFAPSTEDLHVLNPNSGPLEPESVESEYCEKDGRLYIPRVMTHADADEYIATETSDTGVSRLSIVLQESLEAFVPNKSMTPQLWVRDVLLQAVLFAVHSGIEQAADGFNAFIPISQQTVGVVHRLPETQGPETSHQQLSHGDTVLCLKPCAVQLMSIQNTEDLVLLPQVLTQQSLAAAGFWLGPLSAAHYILSDIARMSPGDTLLIDVGKNQVLQHALVLMSHCLGTGKVFVIGSDTIGSASQPPKGLDVTRFVGITRATVASLHSSTGGIDIVVSTVQNPGSQQHLLSSLTDGGIFIGLTDNSTRGTALGIARKRVSFRLFDYADLSFTNSQHSSGLRNRLECVLRWIAAENITLPDPLLHIKTGDTCLVSEFCRGSTLSDSDGEATWGVISLSMSEQVSMFSSPLLNKKTKNGIATQLDPQGTYVVSGGLGALGLPLARMLCHLGARHVVLLSRSGKATSTEAIAELENLTAEGCLVEVVACDITKERDMKLLAARLKSRPKYRLRGIIQSAMVLADRMFANMSIEEWQGAIAPKLRGSWNLHQLEDLVSENETSGSDPRPYLDFFIMLSSISGVIGNTAQANYCAGNTFEDVLAHHRRARGKPGLSLDIGLVSDSSHYGRGTMSGFKNVEEYLAIFGHLTPVKTTTAETLASVKMAILSRANARAVQSESVSPQLPPQLIIGIAAQIPRSQGLLNKWPMDRKFDHRVGLYGVVSPDRTGTGRDQTQLEALEKLMSTNTVEEQRQVVEDMLKGKLSQAMSIDTENIDEQKSLVTYGIDSLKATEVRNWLVRELKCELSVFEILAPISIRKFSMVVLRASNLFQNNSSKSEE